MSKQQFVKELISTLKKHYIKPKSELDHKNEYEFAVAVMLSAQTTDKKVNEVTPGLFARFPSWESLANGSVEEVRDLIYGVNFHLGKGERLITAAQQVVATYDGELPHDVDELVKISGIARKSANVISQELWGVTQGIVVDTHVIRLSNRWKLVSSEDAKKIETDLMEIIDKKDWKFFSSATVLHGRYICVAKRPKCLECPLNHFCPSSNI